MMGVAMVLRAEKGAGCDDGPLSPLFVMGERDVTLILCRLVKWDAGSYNVCCSCRWG